MAIEHLDMLIEEARSGAKELRAVESYRLAARLESCAEVLVKLRDERTARDAEMRDERARVESAESEVARLTTREQTLMRVCEELRRSHPGMTHAHVERLEALTARLATAEKAAHECRELAEGMWRKEHVRAAFVAWYHEGVGFEIDGMTKEEREGPAVRSLEELIVREEGRL